MPELPEVEVVCRSLCQVLVERTIEGFSTTLPKLLKEPAEDAAYFAEHLTRRQVTAIRRRGKYILIDLENAETLTVHLRMTGKLLYTQRQQPMNKHTHIVMPLDNGWDLRFDDVRQFGAFYLTPTDEVEKISSLASLGIEPLSAEFTSDYLKTLMAGRTQKAKAFLLDQHMIAGIGNIYADEILFQASIHPNDRIMDIVDNEDITQLWWAIKDRLSQGIAGGGSSIKDYVDALGRSGVFQKQHRVYGRAGQYCVNCGGYIEKIKVAGRTTCYCPNCQPFHSVD